MALLRPITEDEYRVWLEEVIPEYAADKVTAGQWPEASALELSRKEYEELLPAGRNTENNYLYTVLNPKDQPVGTVWFAAQERGAQRVAYVYDVTIAAEHRRQGHAFRALQELEVEVARLGLDGLALHVFGHNQSARALYVKLGYAATNISMFKALGRACA